MSFNKCRLLCIARRLSQVQVIDYSLFEKIKSRFCRVNKEAVIQPIEMGIPGLRMVQERSVCRQPSQLVDKNKGM